MIKKIKNSLLIMISTLMLALPVALPTAVSYAAGCNGVPETVAGGAQKASGGTVSCDASGGVTNNTQNQVGELANTIVNIFSVIVGAASIIMIIYSGFRYITSGGSTDRIGSAKTTLIYAIIGLIIVALAQVLVHFVISTSLHTSNTLGA